MHRQHQRQQHSEDREFHRTYDEIRERDGTLAAILWARKSTADSLLEFLTTP